jgi:hypothetical protein
MDQEDASNLFASDDAAPADGPWWLLKAQERFAAGHNSTLEAAVWSVTYQDGYKMGLRNARDGSSANAGGRMAELEGYRAGYAAGRKWGLTHPEPVMQVA